MADEAPSTVARKMSYALSGCASVLVVAAGVLLLLSRTFEPKSGPDIDFLVYGCFLLLLAGALFLGGLAYGIAGRPRDATWWAALGMAMSWGPPSFVLVNVL